MSGDGHMLCVVVTLCTAPGAGRWLGPWAGGENAGLLADVTSAIHDFVLLNAASIEYAAPDPQPHGSESEEPSSSGREYRER